MAQRIEFFSRIGSFFSGSEQPSELTSNGYTQLAQADGNTANDANGETVTLPPSIAGATVAKTYTSSEGAKIELGSGTAIDKVIIFAGNLYFVQPDGSVVVIIDGAKFVPTLIVLGAEIPALELARTIEGAGEDVPTAGPVTANDSSGGSFAVPPGQIGPPLDLTALLPPTALQFGLSLPRFFEGLFDEEEGATSTVTPTLEPLEPPEPIEPPTIVPFDEIPVTGPLRRLVKEEAIDSTQTGLDLAPGNSGVLGTNQPSPEESAIGTFKVTTGTGDVNSVEFGATSGIVVTRADGTVVTQISWQVTGNGNLVGSIGGEVAIIIDLQGTATVGTNGGGTIPGGGGMAFIEFIVTITDAFPHSEVNVKDNIEITGIQVVVTDVNNLSASAEAEVTVVDDGPTLTVTGDQSSANTALAVELDETVGTDRANPATTETADGNTDDAGPGLGQVTTSVGAPTTGGLVNLFTVGGDVGSDGGSDTGVLSFVGFPPPTNNNPTPVATNLSATDGGAISLLLVSPTLIEGRDASGTGDLVFTIEIVTDTNGDPQLQTTLFEAIDHGEDGASGTVASDVFDEDITLVLSQAGTIQLQYEVTREDNDGDTIIVAGQVDLISDQTSLFTFDDDGPTLTVTGDQSSANTALAVELDETVGTDRANPATTETADGNTDDAGPGLGQVTTSVGAPTTGGLVNLFTVGGDVGSDGGSDTGVLSFVGFPPPTNNNPTPVATNLSATDGGAISLLLVSPTLIEGRDASGTGDLVFTIEIVTDTNGDPQLQTTLFEAIDHGEDGASGTVASDVFDEDITLVLSQAGTIQLQYEVTREDNDGDTIIVAGQVDLISDQTSLFTFDDDGPTLTVTGDQSSANTALAVELDETVGTDRANPATTETADGNTDDAGPGLGQVTTSVGAPTTGGLVNLFTVGGDVGSDGGSDTGVLSFVGFPPPTNNNPTPVATNLSATDGGAISLLLVSPTLIEGRDASGTGDLVFTIEIVTDTNGDPQLQTTLFEAIDHGEDGASGTVASDVFDEDITLVLSQAGTIQLQYEVTREDNDGDTIIVAGQVDLISDQTSLFTFDDDGPTLTVTGDQSSANTALAVELDETVGTDRANPATTETADGNTDDAGPGLGQVTTSVGAPTTGGLVNLFTVGGDVGSDGGSDTGVLSFVGFPPPTNNNPTPVATNLSATDGGAISLLLVSPTLIEGRDASGTGDLVFTIEIVTDTNGDPQLQTTLFEAIDHGEDGASGTVASDVFDEDITLVLSQAGTIQLQYEVTREDNDGDTIIVAGQVDLISDQTSLFTFDDDGPTLTVTGDQSSANTALAVELDETVGTDRANPATTETADGNTDDAGPGLGQVTTSVGAPTTGGLVNLFTVGGDVGSDGGSDTGVLSFVGFPPPTNNNPTPVATNLSATDGGAISLLLVSPTLIEGRDASGTGDLVFTIEIVTDTNGDPQLQTTLFEAIDHGEDGASGTVASDVFDEDITLVLSQAGTIQLQYEVTREDNDGDTIIVAGQVDLISDQTSLFTFDDDGPKLVDASVMGVVEEEHLSGDTSGTIPQLSTGNEDTTDDTGMSLDTDTSGNFNVVTNVFTGNAGNGQSLANLVDFGSDGLGSFTAKNITGTAVVDSNGVQVTSKNENVTFTSFDNTVAGQTTLTATAGTRTIFTLTIFANGDWTVTFYDQIDHAAPLSPTLAGENLLTLDVSGAVLATDGDGDSIMLSANTFLVKVIDDIPVDFTPKEAFVLNDTNAMATLDLEFAEAVGADEPGDVVFTNIQQGQAATDADGNLLLFNGNEQIYLFVSSDGHTLVGSTNQLFDALIDTYDPVGDPDGDGSVIFNVILDPATDKYKVTVVQETVLNQEATLFDANNDIGGGNPLYVALEGSNGLIDALLTGADGAAGTPQTVNTNNTDIGVNTGQAIGGQDGLEQLRIDFYDDIIDTGGPSEAGDFDVGNHEFTDTFSQFVNQVTATPNNTTADIVSFSVAAITTAPEGADDFVYITDTVGLPQENVGSADEELVFITEVTLVLEDGTIITGTRSGLDGGDVNGIVNLGQPDQENVTFIDFLEDGTVVLDGLSASPQAASSYTIKSSASITGSTSLTLATTLAFLGFAIGDQVTLNATTFTVTDPNTETVQTLINALDADPDASVNLNSSGQIVIIGESTTASLTLGEGAQGTNLASLGLTAGTADADGFSAVQVSSINGEQSFKLGNFVIGSEVIQQPIELEFDIAGTDADSDQVNSTLNVTILPNTGDNVVGTDGNDNNLDGNDSANFIAGLGGNDDIEAFAGNDTIYGGNGNDTIDGGDDDDLIVGGMGADNLTGGDGNDTFFFDAGAVAEAGSIFDLITDFDDSQDLLEVDELLVAISTNLPSGDTLADFVVIEDEAGSADTDLEVRVDADGSANGQNFQTVAELDGITSGDFKVTVVDSDGDTVSGNIVV